MNKKPYLIILCIFVFGACESTTRPMPKAAPASAFVVTDSRTSAAQPSSIEVIHKGLPENLQPANVDVHCDCEKDEEPVAALTAPEETIDEEADDDSVDALLLILQEQDPNIVLADNFGDGLVLMEEFYVYPGSYSIESAVVDQTACNPTGVYMVNPTTRSTFYNPVSVDASQLKSHWHAENFVANEDFNPNEWQFVFVGDDNQVLSMYDGANFNMASAHAEAHIVSAN